MDYRKIVAELDAEISRLQQARDTLAGLNSNVGRSTGARTTQQGTRRGKLSVAARKKISAAKKKWWAARRKGKASA